MEGPSFSQSEPVVGAMTNKAFPIVSPTTEHQAVLRQTAQRDVTGAPSAETLLTGPNHALLSDLLPIITPLHANKWETMLRSCNLYHTFPDIPLSIRNGFDMGVHSTISASYTPATTNPL